MGPSPGAWGRGYAAEAAQACLRWGLDDLALPRVVSFVHPQNRRAARVASAIGMLRVGVTDLRGIKVDVYRADREPPAG